MTRSSSTRTHRADYLFAAYVAGGAGRRGYSLAEFHKDLRAIGISISLGTLKRDSTDFSWQKRAPIAWQALQAERIPQLHRATLVAELRRSHVAQTLLGAGGRALEELLGNDERIGSMRPTDIARLLDLGVRVDRQTAENVQSLHDLTIEVWNDALLSVVRIFVEVNADPLPESRASRFAELLDELVTDRIRGARGGEDHL